MNCDDIKQRLQPFLEDLLVEKEYRAFCGHIETCNKCKVYIRSIGSLSNQIWKLGQIEAPQDLISTIQHKLVYPQERGQPFRIKITQKQAVVGITLIAVAIVVVSGSIYFKKDRNPFQRNDALIVRTEMIRTSAPPGGSEARAQLNQPETIAVAPVVSTGNHITESEAVSAGSQE